MTIRPCPFCKLVPSRILVASDFGIVFRDAYPISPGHTLVIPRRHIVHLIPRYKGDLKDPRGGVRWIFPDKADYWSDR